MTFHVKLSPGAQTTYALMLHPPYKKIKYCNSITYVVLGIKITNESNLLLQRYYLFSKHNT